jgi:hypothetical protein
MQKAAFQKITYLFYALPVLALTACGTPKIDPSVKHLEKSSSIVLLTDTAETSTTVALNPEEKMFLCSNNAPDATFSANNSRGADFSITKTTNNSVDRNVSKGVAGQEMMGRTPAVLTTREYFYRTCELIRNLNLDKKEAIELFKHAMDQSSKLLQSETQNTTISITDGLSNTISQSDNNTQTRTVSAELASSNSGNANTSSDQDAEDEDVSDSDD